MVDDDVCSVQSDPSLLSIYWQQLAVLLSPLAKLWSAADAERCDAMRKGVGGSGGGGCIARRKQNASMHRERESVREALHIPTETREGEGG